MLHRKGPVIAYYITPHGLGHAARSFEIVRSLTVMDPAVKLTIIADIAQSFIEQNLDPRIPVRRTRLDVGLYQYDSLRFDLEKTLSALNRLKSDEALVLEREIEFLRKEQVGVVVSDIPFLPFDAAAACGIPAIGISNFTWDWIYGDYSGQDGRWEPLISWIREKYSKCALFLQLPMHGDCSVCPKIENVALVARKSKRTRAEIRSAIGLRDDQKAVVVAFGSVDLGGEALTELEKKTEVTLLYRSPTRFPLKGAVNMDGMDVSYIDAIAAADAVITKPGYGMVSDCLANGTPMIYTDRGRFPEYDILVETIQRELTWVYIESGEFLAGRWEEAIRRILSLPRKVPSLRTDGADQCARKILDFV